MLPLLNYEQNISLLCRFMLFSPLLGNFPPGPRRGREESCKQNKQNHVAAGPLPFFFCCPAGSGLQQLLHQTQLFPLHGKQLRELLPEFLQRLGYRLQF